MMQKRVCHLRMGEKFSFPRKKTVYVVVGKSTFGIQFVQDGKPYSKLYDWDYNNRVNYYRFVDVVQGRSDRFLFRNAFRGVNNGWYWRARTGKKHRAVYNGLQKRRVDL